jgi:tetratricopeptide (TPR) repeat protein
MKLAFVASLEANLGFALAQLGEVDHAIDVTRAALERCVRLRDKRIEAFTRIYLATMHSLRGEHDLAISFAKQATDMLEGNTAIRAYALATLGILLLEQRQTAPALRCAQEAMDVLNRLGGVDEGESLIRTLNALALRAAGKDPEGRKQIADARKRLIERADRIKNLHWRQSFLERVPDNARLLQLAAQWLDSAPPSAPQWVQ